MEPNLPAMRLFESRVLSKLFTDELCKYLPTLVGACSGVRSQVLFWVEIHLVHICEGPSIVSLPAMKTPVAEDYLALLEGLRTLRPLMLGRVAFDQFGKHVVV